MMTRIFSQVLTVLVCVGCSACGVMLRGQLDRLEDGAVLPLGIETSYGTGRMEASDPVTGEAFTGEYQGTRRGGGMVQGTIWNAQLMQMSTVQGFHTSQDATAVGVLRGNKGTLLHVQMNIRTGLRPTGTGQGVDNKGRHYQVRF